MRTIYIADDETMFETEEDCRAYEYKQEELPRSILDNMTGFNDYGPITDFKYKNPTDELFELFNKSIIIHVLHSWTEEQIAYFENDLGISFPHDKGIHRWDDRNDQWISFEDDVTIFTKQWHNLPGYLNFIIAAIYQQKKDNMKNEG